MDSGSPYLPIETKEFNPADLENLVRFCVQEMESRRIYSLPPPAAFVGAGIYALYYDGEHPLYQHPAIRSPNTVQPIYVGRARLTKTSGVRPLFNRLREHARSIEVADNLNLHDFTCRFLVLHPVWVSTVEDILIGHFDTLWNSTIKGFGVHDPGGKRHTGEIPLWDALHPGRPHALTMLEQGAALPKEDALSELVESFKARRTKHGDPDLLDQEHVDQLLRAAVIADDED
jgi:hypothetical protein